MGVDWLVVDANNMIWRSFHTMEKRPLTQGGRPVGAIYGFLRDLCFLANLHRPEQFAFCFDGEGSFRKELYPEYKQNRRPRTEEEEAQRESVREQITRLRDEVLSELGFNNTLFQRGVEADDVVASVCLKKGHDHELVIASSDKDVLQCLTGNVSVWNFRKKTTLRDFHGLYNFDPPRWAEVKAIAGCATDNVKGVGGVGEYTASKYVAGTLPTTSQYYKRIESGQEIVARNLPLVTLPFIGTKVFTLRENTLDPGVWDRVVKGMGMRTLVGMCPASHLRRPREVCGG